MARTNTDATGENGYLDSSSELRQQMTEGLLYTHHRLNANTTKTLEATAFLYALIELLEEKGLLSIDALDARKAVVAQRLTGSSAARATALCSRIRNTTSTTSSTLPNSTAPAGFNSVMRPAAGCLLPSPSRTSARVSCTGTWASPI